MNPCGQHQQVRRGSTTAMTGFGKMSDFSQANAGGSVFMPSSTRISMLKVAIAMAISITRPVGVRRIASSSARLMLTIPSTAFSRRQNHVNVSRSPHAAPIMPTPSSARKAM